MKHIDKLEPATRESEADSKDQAIAYSIAISLKRIADDIEQIKNGMKFICERWKP